MSVNVARIWLAPEKRLGRVTLHESWVADNFVETATFDTQQEAIDFCRNRWGASVEIFEVGHDGSWVAGARRVQ